MTDKNKIPVEHGGGYKNDLYHKKWVIEEYKRHIQVDTKHIEALWDLGYLPIEIKALPEGTLCPIGVPCFTIRNTHPDFGLLTNYLETLISAMMWQPITSATIAYEYKKLLTKYAEETDKNNVEFVDWQGHDFSMRGMSSIESAILSGMGHLLSFTGTDTIPAIYQLEESYKGAGLIGASVPATEHSVMCMGTKEDEIVTFKRLLDLYPTGILSVVSDTWDLWKVCTEYLPKLKEEILARDGKLVIRPDSGDPVKIITGYKVVTEMVPSSIGECLVENGKYYLIESNWDATWPIKGKELSLAEVKGVIHLLWDIFGSTVNEQGYKCLDPHIGAIYGDSITLERATQICERLKSKGFASTNIVLGIGSYTYQYNTRDTFGFAMKATYGEIMTSVPIDNNGQTWHTDKREIFKDPITDDGTKKSKKGLLKVLRTLDISTIPKSMTIDEYIEQYPYSGNLIVRDQCTWEEESQGLLQTVFKDGKLIKETTLEEIRNRLKQQ